jgi:hypothetical protein
MGSARIALQADGGTLSETPTAPRVKQLSEFFGFVPRASQGEFYEQFSDCSLFDIYLDFYVKDWPGQSGSPPHPGLFADCFEILLRSAVQHDAVLTLYIKSLDRTYFDELDFIKACLTKECARFLLLSRRDKHEKYSYEGTHDLFFEWPREQGRLMVREWFMSPQVTIEGYVSKGPIFQEISSCSSLASTPGPPRELLDSLEMAFRLWPDFNGISILTRKMSSNDLLRMLDNEDLRRAIAASLGREGGIS